RQAPVGKAAQFHGIDLLDEMMRIQLQDATLGLAGVTAIGIAVRVVPTVKVTRIEESDASRWLRHLPDESRPVVAQARPGLARIAAFGQDLRESGLTVKPQRGKVVTETSRAGLCQQAGR